MSRQYKVLPEWSANIQQVLFTPEMIQAKVAELGARISKDYSGKEVLCVGLLNGAFVFMADIMRQLSIKYDVDFIAVSSYGSGTSSSGSVKVKKDLNIDPFGTFSVSCTPAQTHVLSQLICCFYHSLYLFRPSLLVILFVLIILSPLPSLRTCVIQASMY